MAIGDCVINYVNEHCRSAKCVHEERQAAMEKMQRKQQEGIGAELRGCVGQMLTAQEMSKGLVQEYDIKESCIETEANIRAANYEAEKLREEQFREVWGVEDEPSIDDDSGPSLG